MMVLYLQHLLELNLFAFKDMSKLEVGLDNFQLIFFT